MRDTFFFGKSLSIGDGFKMFQRVFPYSSYVGTWSNLTNIWYISTGLQPPTITIDDYVSLIPLIRWVSIPTFSGPWRQVDGRRSLFDQSDPRPRFKELSLYIHPEVSHGTWKWAPGEGNSFWKLSFCDSMLICRGCIGTFFPIKCCAWWACWEVATGWFQVLFRGVPE